jgi:biotin transport system substrate-specific component
MGIKNNKLKYLILSALFAALISVGAFIQIPLPFVPITLQLFFVFFAAIILPPLYSVISTVIYISLGLIGLPIFAGGKGGFQHVLSPTFGYAAGFILCVFIIGIILKNIKQTYLGLFAACLAGLLAVYIFGTIYFCALSVLYFGNEITVNYVLGICVIPFIPGDLVKIALAVMLGKRLKRV